jgi:hypothetical protein
VSNIDAIQMLGMVAEVLQQLPQRIVFTGGATISLYLDDYSIEDMRPTDDVDCVVEILSQPDYYRLAKALSRHSARNH